MDLADTNESEVEVEEIMSAQDGTREKIREKTREEEEWKKMYATVCDHKKIYSSLHNQCEIFTCLHYLYEDMKVSTLEWRHLLPLARDLLIPMAQAGGLDLYVKGYQADLDGAVGVGGNNNSDSSSSSRSAADGDVSFQGMNGGAMTRMMGSTPPCLLRWMMGEEDVNERFQIWYQRCPIFGLTRRIGKRKRKRKMFFSPFFERPF